MLNKFLLLQPSESPGPGSPGLVDRARPVRAAKQLRPALILLLVGLLLVDSIRAPTVTFSETDLSKRVAAVIKYSPTATPLVKKTLLLVNMFFSGYNQLCLFDTSLTLRAYFQVDLAFDKCLMVMTGTKARIICHHSSLTRARVYQFTPTVIPIVIENISKLTEVVTEMTGLYFAVQHGSEADKVMLMFRRIVGGQEHHVAGVYDVVTQLVTPSPNGFLGYAVNGYDFSAALPTFLANIDPASSYYITNTGSVPVRIYGSIGTTNFAPEARILHATAADIAAKVLYTVTEDGWFRVYSYNSPTTITTYSAGISKFYLEYEYQLPPTTSNAFSYLTYWGDNLPFVSFPWGDKLYVFDINTNTMSDTPLDTYSTDLGSSAARFSLLGAEVSDTKPNYEIKYFFFSTTGATAPYDTEIKILTYSFTDAACRTGCSSTTCNELYLKRGALCTGYTVANKAGMRRGYTQGRIDADCTIDNKCFDCRGDATSTVTTDNVKTGNDKTGYFGYYFYDVDINSEYCFTLSDKITLINSGYLEHTTKSHWMVKCKVAGCIACDDQRKCTRCTASTHWLYTNPTTTANQCLTSPFPEAYKVGKDLTTQGGIQVVRACLLHCDSCRENYLGCTHCETGYYADPTTNPSGECKVAANLPPKYGPTAINSGIARPCTISKNCETCNLNSVDECVTCPTSSTYYLGKMVSDTWNYCRTKENIPDGYGIDTSAAGTWAQCSDPNCKNCRTDKTSCDACTDGYMFRMFNSKNTCYPTPAAGSGFDPTDPKLSATCISATPGCATCQFDFNVCETCLPNYFFHNPAEAISCILKENFPDDYGAKSGAAVLTTAQCTTPANCLCRDDSTVCSGCTKTSNFVFHAATTSCHEEGNLPSEYGLKVNPDPNAARVSEKCKVTNCLDCKSDSTMCTKCLPNKWLHTLTTPHQCLSVTSDIPAGYGVKLNSDPLATAKCTGHDSCLCQDDNTKCTGCITTDSSVFDSTTENCYTVNPLPDEYGFKVNSIPRVSEKCKVTDCLKCSADSTMCTACKDSKWLHTLTTPLRCISIASDIPAGYGVKLNSDPLVTAKCTGHDSCLCQDDNTECSSCITTDSSVYDLITKNCYTVNPLPEGYGFKVNSIPRVSEKCIVENCLKCNDDSSKCTKCEPNIWLHTLTAPHRCIIDKANIPAHYGAKGTELVTAACSDSKCKICSNDNTVCEVCDTDYYSQADTKVLGEQSGCVLVKDIPNKYGIDKDTPAVPATKPCQDTTCDVCTNDYKVCKACLDPKYFHKGAGTVGTCKTHVEIPDEYGIVTGTATRTTEACSSGLCKECRANSQSCEKCKKDIYFFADHSPICFEKAKIPKGNGPNIDTMTVEACTSKHADCAECGDNVNVCEVCRDSFYLHGTGSKAPCLTQDKIPEGFGIKAKTKITAACVETECKKCQPDSSSCEECKNNKYVFIGNAQLCVTKADIPKGKGPNTATKFVASCAVEKCAACADDYSVCTECVADSKNLVLKNNKCVLPMTEASAHPEVIPEPTPQPTGSVTAKFDAKDAAIVGVQLPSEESMKHVTTSLELRLYQPDGTYCAGCINMAGVKVVPGKVKGTFDIIPDFTVSVSGATLVGLFFDAPNSYSKYGQGRLLQEAEQRIIVLKDVYSDKSGGWNLNWLTKVYGIVVKITHMIGFKLLLFGFLAVTALRLHSTLSLFTVLRLLNGRLIKHSHNFLVTISSLSYFGFITDSPFVDQSRGKCVPSQTTLSASYECGLIDNYGTNLLILLIAFTFCGVVALLTHFKIIRLSFRRFRPSNFGLRWIYAFLAGITLEIFPLLFLSLWNHYSSPTMGGNVFLTILFFLIYLALIGGVVAVGRDASKLPSEEDAQKRVAACHMDFFWHDIHIRTPCGAMHPAVVLLKSALQALLTIVLQKAKIVQLVIILSVELAYLGYLFAGPIFKKSSTKVIEVIQNLLLCIFISLKAVGYADLGSTDRADGLGGVMVLVLVVMLLVALAHTLFEAAQELLGGRPEVHKPQMTYAVVYEDGTNLGGQVLASKPGDKIFDSPEIAATHKLPLGCILSPKHDQEAPTSKNRTLVRDAKSSKYTIENDDAIDIVNESNVRRVPTLKGVRAVAQPTEYAGEAVLDQEYISDK